MICFKNADLLLYLLLLKELKNMKLNDFYVVITCSEAVNT